MTRSAVSSTDKVQPLRPWQAGGMEGKAAQLALGEKLHTRWKEGGNAVVAQSFHGERIDCCVSVIRQETRSFNLQALTDSCASVCVCVRVSCKASAGDGKKKDRCLYEYERRCSKKGKKMDVQQIK